MKLSKPLMLLLAGSLLAGCTSMLDVASHKGGKALIAKPVYVSGVKAEGLPTLPAPKETAHLKVINAGFWVGVDGKKPNTNTVAYEYTLNIKKPYADEVYQEAILANPSQASKPFVYSQVLKKAQRSMKIMHSPLKDLAIGQAYTLKINIYADKAHTRLLESLEQEVVSPFDTRQGCLRMAPGTPLPLDTDRFCFPI